ncbi:MAG: amino acid permease [Gemmatimonadaceae bacterium]|nr:amino acid permease [Gemmatimonadaceae bacterium]
MTDRESAPRNLRRSLGAGSAALMVVGGIIGSGIFFTPAEVARALPSGGWIMGVWVLGGVLAFAGALTYAELGAMLPDAGGPYVYIRRAFGSLPAFLYGWMALMSIASGAIAAVSMGFAGYLAQFVDLEAVGGQLGAAAGTIAVLTLTNVLGLRPGLVLQNVLTTAKIVALAVLVCGGLVAWAAVADPLPVPGAPAPRESLVAGAAAAFVAVLFTIGGWQQMNMVAGEIRDPQRSIPRALVVGVAIVVAIYLGANAVYLHTLGRDGLAASSAVAADAMRRMVGPVGATFIALAAMLSILGFVNVAIISNSRLPYALAVDGLFVAMAGHVHPRLGTPWVSILLLGAWSLVLLIGSRGRIGDLLSGVVFADWIFFGLGAASVFVLRRTEPHLERPYRVPGYPLVPGLFVVAAAGGVASAFIAAPGMSLLGCGLLGAGVVIYVATRRRSS